MEITVVEGYGEAVSGKVKVTLGHIGEGWFGDYDPEDPEDEELLRFDVYRYIGGGDWESVDDASYCTQLRKSSSAEMITRALTFLLSEVVEEVEDGHSIKKLCERLSWIGPEWLESTVLDETLI